MSGIGVAAWLWAWVATVDVEPTSASASTADESYTEGEVWFPSAVSLVIPATLPMEEAVSERYALLVWSLGGQEAACAYAADGDVYRRQSCDVPVQGPVQVDYVGVWSDVESVVRRPGGRIFIDFSGAGVVVRCDGQTHYLGNVSADDVDFQAICPGS